MLFRIETPTRRAAKGPSRDRRPRRVGRRDPRTSRRESFRYSATTVRRKARPRRIRQSPELRDVLQRSLRPSTRETPGSGGRIRSPRHVVPRRERPRDGVEPPRVAALQLQARTPAFRLG